MNQKNAQRTIYIEDALEWLSQYIPKENHSFVASLPDISEFTGMSLSEWKNWFVNTSALILSKIQNDDVAIFYQSDIKIDGLWVDKGYLCLKAAEQLDIPLLWHKIICRSPAGMATFGRPAYSHLICFSRNLKLDYAKSTPDVIPNAGEKTWERGMGFEVCYSVAKFIKEQTKSQTIVHPFCGEGGMMAMANFFNLDAIGIDRSPKRGDKARRLTVDEVLRAFYLNNI